MIHPTHSKKDLCEIIEIYSFYQIEDYHHLKKTELAEALWDQVCQKDFVPAESEYLFVDDITDLREYLRKPCGRQITTNAVRIDVNNRVKNIIFYCRECGYFLTASNYLSVDDVRYDAEFIKNYGDLPSVRRALRLYNNDPKANQPILPTMTRRVKRREEEKASLKRKNTLTMCFTKGEYILKFD